MLQPLFGTLLDAVEAGRLPDLIVRSGIRRLLAERRAELYRGGPELQQSRIQALLEQCAQARIAEVPERANAQHYEVPAALYEAALGPRLKYSCCHWGPGVDDLAAAEEDALRITCERARLADGQQILELGCGWGALSLWMAERYPRAEIVAVSNSNGQRLFIERRARERGLTNLRVLTADMNEFVLDRAFDRVVSVEMFEHMRNHGRLLQRIAGWLRPGGNLFVHLFCHRAQPYLFEDAGPRDWMSRYFFTGGMMPSDALLLYHQRDLQVTHHWRWSGRHYERTCNAWLTRFDSRASDLREVLTQTYGARDCDRWRQRWRIFFMACAELFGWADGEEWWVAHYLFEKPRS